MFFGGFVFVEMDLLGDGRLVNWMCLLDLASFVVGGGRWGRGVVLYLEEMNTWKGICETGKVARCFSYPGRATQRGIVSLCSLLNYERQACFVALYGRCAYDYMF